MTGACVAHQLALYSVKWKKFWQESNYSLIVSTYLGVGMRLGMRQSRPTCATQLFEPSVVE